MPKRSADASVALVLLDTTVASLFHPKKKRSTLRAWYEPHLQGKVLVLSFQSVAELRAWAVENRWGAKQRRNLEAFLHRFLVVSYDLKWPRCGLT